MTSLKYRWLALAYFLNFFVAQAQISVTDSPQNLQLFPRNAFNKAFVSFGGVVSTADIHKISLVVKKENVFWDYQIQAMPPIFTSAISFNIQTAIEALPAEYSFKLYAHYSVTDSVLVMSRERIVCGDIYLLYGQSNIVAQTGIDQANAETDDRLLRNFDFGAGYDPNTLQWFAAKQPYAQVGTLGLKIQQLILQQHGIPTAVINSAVGGQSIAALNYRNSNNHYDPSTFYGRLALRALKAGAVGNIKGIIWRQGEYEAASWILDVNNYPNNFDILYQNLKEDLGEFDKLYNIQIGIYNVGFNGGGTLREFQRKTKYLYPNIETYTCLGVPTTDGYHHLKEGYDKIATELTWQIEANSYNSTDTNEVKPPDIKKIYKKASNDTLVLVFDKNQQMKFPNDTTINGNFWSLKNYFYINGQNNVISNAWASGNSVFLKTNQALGNGFVNYLPANYSPLYEGTHLKNSRGLRAFSFQNFQVANQLSIVPHISSVVKVNENSVTVVCDITPNNLPSGSTIVLERRKNQETTFTEVQYSSDLLINDDLDMSQVSALFYRIRVVNEVSESVYSNVAQLVTLPCGAPQNLSGTSPNANNIYSGVRINSTQTITQPTHYEFGEFADLQPNFNALSNTFFEVKYKSCN